MSDIDCGKQYRMIDDKHFKCKAIRFDNFGDVVTDLHRPNKHDMNGRFSKALFSKLFELDDEQEHKDEPKHSHYHKNVSGYETIDIYVICDLYVKDNSGCIQHAVKKLLCCGNRGVKDNVKDLQEAIDTIQRKIEILQGKSEAADE